MFDQIQLQAVPHPDMWSKASAPGSDQEILTAAACCSRLEDRKNFSMYELHGQFGNRKFRILWCFFGGV